MRYWSPVALLVAWGGTALAQPAQPPGPPGQPPSDPPPVDPVPTPTPTPTPTPIPVVPAPPPAPAPAADGSEHRPSAWSLALGFGYDLPTSLQTPNIASLRVRLPSGLTFEPQIVLESSSEEVDIGPSTEDKASQLGAALRVRFTLFRRGRVDLEILGGFGFDRQKTEPEDPDMDLTVTTLGVSYGVAVGAWITPHWQVSLSTLDNLVTNTRRDQEMGPGTSTVTTNTTFGLELTPTVQLMVHLYH